MLHGTRAVPARCCFPIHVGTGCRFAGADAIALGHQLEIDVLKNDFRNPQDEEYPIDR